MKAVKVLSCMNWILCFCLRLTSTSAGLITATSFVSKLPLYYVRKALITYRIIGTGRIVSVKMLRKKYWVLNLKGRFCLEGKKDDFKKQIMCLMKLFLKMNKSLFWRENMTVPSWCTLTKQ